jgi:predicted transcriptional regulator
VSDVKLWHFLSTAKGAAISAPISAGYLRRLLCVHVSDIVSGIGNLALALLLVLILRLRTTHRYIPFNVLANVASIHPVGLLMP